MRPGLQLKISRLSTCRPLPQIVALMILTITCVGAAISGFGRSCKAFFAGLNERFHRYYREAGASC
jgi:hypothetical protein